jgi:hypothetical protein
MAELADSARKGRYTPAGMSDETRDRIGQGLALLLVAGLIGLVIWFAQGLEQAGFEDASAPGDAALDAAADADAIDAADASAPFGRTNLHLALFGAVVEEVTGLPYAVGEGCVLAVELTRGPRIHRVRLTCRDEVYASAVYDEAIGEVVEARTENGPAYSARYTSPDGGDGARLSVDTSLGTIVLLGGGGGRLRLRVEALSVARPGEPFEESAPDATGEEPPGGECSGSGWVGVVHTEDEVLAPLTLASDGDGARLELFDASAETISEVTLDCEAGTATMTGETSEYTGRFGPANATILGRARLNGEPALFWLRRDIAEGSSAEPPP